MSEGNYSIHYPRVLWLPFTGRWFGLWGEAGTFLIWCGRLRIAIDVPWLRSSIFFTMASKSVESPRSFLIIAPKV